MDFLILPGIGLLMGLFGGLLGIGGSIVMIPALTFAYGENQHLYQAAAMICNFFVAGASLIAHRKAEAFVGSILKKLIPAAIVGVLGGVAFSNSPLFAGQNSFWLARLFGAFLVYVAAYNALKLRPGYKPLVLKPPADVGRHGFISAGIGLLTGLGAGLLGIGAGTVSTPLQQITLKVPLRNAMSNSAAAIVSIAWLGAIYKNATLPEHNIPLTDSLRIAVFVMPTAVLGGFIGGHLMHVLPKNLVRIVFIGVCILAAIKLLTVQPG